MTIYGVVFAAPFVALSFFPTALGRLPVLVMDGDIENCLWVH
ncbi:MAG: hypothetical protein Ct9H300mP9_8010 [Candidatus Neomarinimicrobiota bacterium]|nr:MAG: hypothetical protein Ct9H300mP9_8010 [Candidatus Neomarinimicrobiota bacterium]